MKQLQSLWKKYAIRGFIIGMIPFLFFISLDYLCQGKEWCGLQFLEIFWVFYITLAPLYLLSLFVFPIINLQSSQRADVILFLLRYSYPIIYALYGTIIGIGVARWRRRKER